MHNIMTKGHSHNMSKAGTEHLCYKRRFSKKAAEHTWFRDTERRILPIECETYSQVSDDCFKIF